MALSLDGIFGVHEQALYLRSQRTELLATNLANADTPNYKAKDMDFESALRAAQGDPGGGALRTTNARHIATDGNGSGNTPVLYRVPTQPSLDGNTVETQVEQAQFARNALHYQATLMFMDRRIKEFISAVKGE